MLEGNRGRGGDCHGKKREVRRSQTARGKREKGPSVNWLGEKYMAFCAFKKKEGGNDVRRGGKGEKRTEAAGRKDRRG